MEDEKKYGDVISPDEACPTEDGLPNSDRDTGEIEASESEHHSTDALPPTENDMPEDSSLVDELPPSSPQVDPPPPDVDYFRQIDGKLESIAGTEQRLFSEVREMHKLYHAEFAGRLKAMQDELEHYRKIDKGRAFDDILASIARIYDNNETLADEVVEPKAQKSIRYMRMDIEDLLGMYGMEKLRSEPGEKRNPRHCQVLNRIFTDNPAKHDTVAKSYNSGFYLGNRTVIKEVVDIYIYAGQSLVQETEEKAIIETGDIPIAE